MFNDEILERCEGYIDLEAFALRYSTMVKSIRYGAWSHYGPPVDVSSWCTYPSDDVLRLACYPPTKITGMASVWSLVVSIKLILLSNVM